MILVEGFGCLELCLYGIRELALQHHDLNQSECSIWRALDLSIRLLHSVPVSLYLWSAVVFPASCVATSVGVGHEAPELLAELPGGEE